MQRHPQATRPVLMALAVLVGPLALYVVGHIVRWGFSAGTAADLLFVGFLLSLALVFCGLIVRPERMSEVPPEAMARSRPNVVHIEDWPRRLGDGR